MRDSDKPAVQRLEVAVDQAGQRIDNFLLHHFKGVPRSRIYRILRKGEVRVNRGRAKPDYRLCAGDELRLPPLRVPEPTTATVPATAQTQLARRVLYEDTRLLVIDKPAGMAVHGGSGLSFGVIEALRADRAEAHFLELAHRLDRETSGCLMVAKKRSELRMLHELLRTGRVLKRYLLLVEGRWDPALSRVDAPLRKNQLQGGERVVRVDAAGKPAVTRFRPLQDFGVASLLEAELETGRTHQIRVHAAHSGHPIAGDERYGSPEFNARMRTLGLKRLFLHAHYLEFEDAEHARAVEVSAPLADDLGAVLDRLET